MKRREFSLTMKALIVVFIIFLLADAVLGAILLRQSRENMLSLIQDRMLDVSGAAAATLDGDQVRQLTADTDSQAHRETAEALNLFQQNIKLDYIYLVRDNGDGSFSFLIDPDEVAPGSYGEPLLHTDALLTAAGGTPAVSSEPHTDYWGRFYSAYSPVFDSDGEVAGIVAVDFNAEWYESHLARSTRSVVVISLLSVLLGAAIVVFITNRFHRRFSELHVELNTLSDDMDALRSEIEASTQEGMGDGNAAARAASVSALDGRTGQDDEIVALGKKIRSLQKELRDYLAFAKKQAFIDPMTGFGNKTAYLEMLKAAEPHLNNGTARFTVTIFDIDDLKGINDNYGHEVGDLFIADAAEIIRSSFGDDHVYRIGGDEFIAVRANAGAAELAEWSERLKAEVRRSAEGAHRHPVSLSWGSAVYDPEIDADYRSVFKRADEEMYRYKAEYYSNRGGRRSSAHPFR